MALENAEEVATKEDQSGTKEADAAVTSSAPLNATPTDTPGWAQNPQEFRLLDAVLKNKMRTRDPDDDEEEDEEGLERTMSDREKFVMEEWKMVAQRREKEDDRRRLENIRRQEEDTRRSLEDQRRSIENARRSEEDDVRFQVRAPNRWHRQFFCTVAEPAMSVACRRILCFGITCRRTCRGVVRWTMPACSNTLASSHRPTSSVFMATISVLKARLVFLRPRALPRLPAIPIRSCVQLSVR